MTCEFSLQKKHHLVYKIRQNQVGFEILRG